MREPNILAAPAVFWRGRCCQNVSLLSSFLFPFVFWWIELNLRLNTGCPCQGSLLTISCSLGLQLHFLPNSLLHNLANVFFFYNWAKGNIWTTFLGVKCKQSWGMWAREMGRTYVAVNNVFYCKPSLTQYGGEARICVPWECTWAPSFLDVALYDSPGATQGSRSGLVLDRGSPDPLSRAHSSVLASQPWNGCQKHKDSFFRLMSLLKARVRNFLNPCL